MTDEKKNNPSSTPEKPVTDSPSTEAQGTGKVAAKESIGANPETNEASKAEAKATPKPKAKKDPRDKLYRPGVSLMLDSSPHDYGQAKVPTIMWNVVGALMPATLAGIYYFGIKAAILILVCTLTALLTELIMNRLKGEELTLADGSAAITGLLLALTLPPSFSPYLAALGAFFAIAIGKQIFGGLGYNIFNPALLGRAFLQASFPVAMTTWTWPGTAKFASLDGVAAATPLGLMKFEQKGTEFLDMLVGNTGGSIGETSAVLVMLGGLYLLVRKFADWRIPLSFALSVILFGGIFHLLDPSAYPSPLFHLLGGGFMLGAFFMATDMVTSPITPKGSLLFGFGAGLLLVVVRLFGGLPEGVMYVILLMNAGTPLLNRYTRPKFLGEVRAGEVKA